MGRAKGSKNFSRRLLQDVLAEKNIDLIGDYYALLMRTDDDIQARMLMHLIEFVFPKRRAEDSSGDAGAIGVVTPIDPETLLMLAAAAREKK